ncbi:MAG TPA: phosphoribosyltransferase, partial [Albitalea sp.]|nr:phosphoribosyltransferase [Albitalea sp.]
VLSDRIDAGRQLAARLVGRFATPPLVLALPRGGVPVAAEIASALHAPLDLLFVRKIGTPFEPELAYAAVVDGVPPQTVVNQDVAAFVQVGEHYLADETKRELEEIARRRAVYLAGRAPLPVQGRDVVLVDDGLATGTTARAAILALRRNQPASLTLAVPVAPEDTVRELQPLVDALVCLAMPEPFRAIGLHYDDFHQLDDEEVIELMERFNPRRSPE